MFTPMWKQLPLAVLIILVIASCTPSEKTATQEATTTIIALQEKASQEKTDIAFYYLERVDRILDSFPGIHDSLRTENLYQKGAYYQRAEQRDSAAIYYHKAADRIDKQLLNEHTLNYFIRGWSNDLTINDEAGAVSLANSLIDMCDPSEDFRALYFAYNSLERVYRRLRKFEEQFKYNQLAYDMAVKDKDTYHQSLEKTTRAETLAALGRIDEAYSSLNPLVANEEQNNATTNAMIFLHYGIVQFYDGDFLASIDNYKKSLTYIALQEDSFLKDDRLATAYCNIGESYRELKNTELEEKYIDSALTYAFKSNVQRRIKYVFKQKMKTKFESSPMALEVIADFDSLVKYQNTNYQNKINKELQDLNIANENEKVLQAAKKEAEIKVINQRSRMIVLGVIASILLLIGYIIYQRRSFKFAKQKLQIQQRLLRSQMNPHFTFNTLASIQNQIKTDPKKASSYLIKFSRLLRLILENSTSNFILLEKEIDSLKKYMDLQLLRFPGKFEYTIHFENMEEDEFVFIPPMLLQPIVENSIEHGFEDIHYVGRLDITLSRPPERDRAGKRNFIACRIEDNGRGFYTKDSERKQSLSTGLINSFLKDATKSKMSVLNKKDTDPSESGILTDFLIPFKLTDND
jgi:LytS/YehU family sensor histidine kinase